MPAVSTSLRPVAGNPRQIAVLVGRWLAEGDAPPLTVRTSGSTGEAKDVLLSVAAMRASAEAALARLGGPGQWLLALPASYVAGLQVLVRSELGGEAAAILAEHPDLATSAARLTGRRRYVACVPTQLRRWLADGPSAAVLKTFDAVLVGGGPTDNELLEWARDHDVSVVRSYGMTETCGGCVYDGVPLDSVKQAIDATGRIRLSGPVLFDGYAGRPDLTAQVLRDGWLVTPDVGELDAHGRLVVTGRVDDLVKSGGVTVSLQAVERRLATMPGVSDVAVLGAPDPEWGTRVIAVLVGQPVPDLAAVRAYVSDVHPRAWAPREVRLVSRLPRLASGKVDRQHLARVLLDRS